MAELPLALALLGLAAYAVLGGADFGAGLWELTARGERGRRLREHTHHAMAPVWEANHVWLIFVLVVLWTAYPEAFASIASTLTIPLFIAGIGIVLRGTSYALRSGDPTPREEAGLSLVLGLSSVLTPFALGAAVGGIAAGRVPVGNAAGEPLGSWTGPTSLTIGALAIATAAYLAAVYLAADAARVGQTETAEAFRRRALGAGVLAGGLALAGPFVLHSDARPLYDGLTSGAGLVALLGSAAAGLVTLALVWRRRYEPARVFAALAVAAIVAGWGLGQRPSFLPGLSIEEAAAGDATIVATLIAIVAGMALIVPSLAFLFRLVLSGRFDAGSAEAKPTRDRPITPATSRLRPLAVAVTLALGAAATFVFSGWVRGAGVAAMLVASTLAFGLLAVPDEDRPRLPSA